MPKELAPITITDEEVKALLKEDRSYRWGGYGFWAVAVLIFVGLNALLLSAPSDPEASDIGAFGLVIGAILFYIPFAIGIYISYRLIIKQLSKRVVGRYAIRKLAQHNDMTYIASYEQIHESDIPGRYHASVTALVTAARAGAIFNTGRFAQTTSIFGNDQCALFGYVYDTGSGRKREVHTWQVAVYRLPRRLPHMLFDSKSNNPKIFGSNLPKSFDRSQKIDAGQLSLHFDVYAPDDYEIDVLSVIGPDVAEALVDYAADSEVEIVDDVLLVYKRIALDDTSAEKVYNTMRAIVSRLEDDVTSYRDDRAATAGDRHKIAPKGTRLRRRFVPAILAAVGISLLVSGGIVVSILTEVEDPWSIAPIALVLFLAPAAVFLLAFTIVRTSQRARTNKVSKRSKTHDKDHSQQG